MVSFVRTFTCRGKICKVHIEITTKLIALSSRPRRHALCAQSHCLCIRRAGAARMGESLQVSLFLLSGPGMDVMPPDSLDSAAAATALAAGNN